MLGNGSRVSAQDTVPFAIWCALARLDDYRSAVWTAIEAGGTEVSRHATEDRTEARAHPATKA